VLVAYCPKAGTGFRAGRLSFLPTGWRQVLQDTALSSQLAKCEFKDAGDYLLATWNWFAFFGVVLFQYGSHTPDKLSVDLLAFFAER
jgi:hypothetical protein